MRFSKRTVYVVVMVAAVSAVLMALTVNALGARSGGGGNDKGGGNDQGHNGNGNGNGNGKATATRCCGRRSRRRCPVTRRSTASAPAGPVGAAAG